MIPATVYLRYVTHEDVPAFEAKGWRKHSDMQRHHGHYSILMIWEGDGEPA
jgi:hypothetical protein